ncbi:MAG: heme exporter protein CcmD [Gammaproteobacteria bacterium]|jgi:heme exporter protein CcmD|nr:heme exporter protein CcmD [Gammaproteobacteria bacterium]
MTEFLEMGGYARYVWSAFGLSLTVLVIMVYWTRRSLRVTRQRLARRQQSMQGVGG